MNSNSPVEWRQQEINDVNESRNSKEEIKNYNSKREDLEEEDQGEDERNVIL